MKTKLKIIIEVEESLDQTSDLFLELFKKEKSVKIKNIFDADSEIFLKSMSGINSTTSFQTFQQAVRGELPEEPEETILELVMMKR